MGGVDLLVETDCGMLGQQFGKLGLQCGLLVRRSGDEGLPDLGFAGSEYLQCIELAGSLRQQIHRAEAGAMHLVVVLPQKREILLDPLQRVFQIAFA